MSRRILVARHSMALAVLLSASLRAAGSADGIAAAPAVSTASALPAAAAVIRVHMKQFMFAPFTVTVKAGSTVTWTNMDDEPHTIASADGRFRSGALDTNESYSYRFVSPGTYRYICTIHPQMAGTIVVQ